MVGEHREEKTLFKKETKIFQIWENYELKSNKYNKTLACAHTHTLKTTPVLIINCTNSLIKTSKAARNVEPRYKSDSSLPLGNHAVQEAAHHHL